MTEIDDIAADFEFLEDWDQRYQYLVELGEALAVMPEADKIEDNKVKGCMSQVWVKAYRDETQPEMIHFYGDCDTSIIKGVVAVLVNLFSAKTADEIIALDVDGLFEKIQLAEHLSPNRHFGIYAVVDVMKTQVKNLG